jgi:hypothetical protein
VGERTNRADSSTARSSARSCSTVLDSAVVEGTVSPGFVPYLAYTLLRLAVAVTFEP